LQDLEISKPKEKLFVIASLTWTLAICFVQLVEIALHPTRICAEAAMALDAARHLCLGKVPYNGCFVFDEPLAIIVRVFPALAAFILHVHPIPVLSLFVLFIFALSAFLLVEILKPACSRFGALNCTLLIFAYGLLTINFRFEFGQNEHLFVLLYAPYVMARLVRNYGLKVEKKIASLAGVLCLISLGVAIHLWLFLLLFEMYIFADGKLAGRNAEGGLYRGAPEVRALFVTAMVVCLFLLPVWPSYFQDYLKLALASQNMFHIDLYYQTLSPDRRDVLYWFTFAFVLGTALRSSCEILMPLLVNCLTAFILYLIWQDGSSHSLIPLNAFVCLVLAIELSLVVSWAWKRFHPAGKELTQRSAATLLFVLCITPALIGTAWQCTQVSFKDFKSLGSIDYLGYFNREDMAVFSDLIESNSHPKDEIFILSYWPRPAYPAILQMHREQASRYLCGSSIRILSQLKEERSNMFLHLLKGSEARIFQNLVKDVLEKQPSFLVIQNEGLLSEPEAALLKEILEKDYQRAGSQNTQELSWPDEGKLHPVELLGYSYGLTFYKHK
jgi:hypothetical protein